MKKKLTGRKKNKRGRKIRRMRRGEEEEEGVGECGEKEEQVSGKLKKGYTQRFFNGDRKIIGHRKNRFLFFSHVRITFFWGHY